MRVGRMALAVSAGLALSALVASRTGMPGTDTSVMLSWAVGGTAVASLAAALLLRAARSVRIGTQAVIAALAPLGAVAVGIWAAAAAMFISAHDLSVLLVVLVGAGTVGVVTALVLGARVAEAAASISDWARAIGNDGTGEPAPTPAAGPGVPGELAEVRAQLEAALARLAESRRQAAALEESRRELVAWVSHDLRTPLSGIRAMVEALEDGLVEDHATVSRYYRTIRHEADRLSGLVDDLFELSRINAGALTLDLELVSLDELVSDAVAGVALAAGTKGIELRGTVDAPPPVVELSVREMSRVVRNLLDNAIRHTPCGGRVLVEASVDPGREAAVVSVSDGCGGIPAADLARVFELAYRGDAARTPSDGGAGLGLAVARGLVEAHSGEISVANGGDGCRFTVRLPLASAVRRAEAPPLP